MRVAIIIWAVSAVGHAQFLRPSLPGRQGPSVSSWSFSSSWVAGQDGNWHQETHEVNKQMFHHGPDIEQRVSHVDCHDGNCQQASSSMWRPGQAFLERMKGGAPVLLYHGRGCMGHMMERVAALKTLLTHRIQHHMWTPMRPPMDIKIMHPVAMGPMVIDDAQPGSTLGAEAVVPMPPTVPETQDLLVLAIGGMSIIAIAFSLVMLIRNCVCRKEARELPLEALGQPLEPAGQAELGLASSVSKALPVAGAFQAPPEEVAAKAYLQELYTRVTPKTDAEVAAVYLCSLYERA